MVGMQSISQKVKEKNPLWGHFRCPSHGWLNFVMTMQLLQMLLGFFIIKVCNKNEDIVLSLGFSIIICHHNEGIAKTLWVFYWPLYNN
jgi:hypothetical protein